MSRGVEYMGALDRGKPDTVPPEDPRNWRRYRYEAIIVALIALILLVPPGGNGQTPWWLWMIIVIGFIGRGLLFWHDVRKYERWQHEVRP